MLKIQENRRGCANVQRFSDHERAIRFAGNIARSVIRFAENISRSALHAFSIPKTRAHLHTPGISCVFSTY
jgi:hypothetical protein